jgi:hypothetical protein
MEKRTKKDFPNFDWQENKSGLVTGKTSSDNPVLLTNFVTGYLLQGYILTTIWLNHKGKI